MEHRIANQYDKKVDDSVSIVDRKTLIFFFQHFMSAKEDEDAKGLIGGGETFGNYSIR